MEKLVKESLYENFNPTDDYEEDQKFLKEEISKIENAETYKDVRKIIFKITAGFHFPFNPPSPIREVFRNKFQELHDKCINKEEKNDIDRFLKQLEGEWKPIDIPKGAMF